MFKKTFILCVILQIIRNTNQDDLMCPLSVTHGKLSNQIVMMGKKLEIWETIPYIASSITDLDYFHTLRIKSDKDTISPSFVIYIFISQEVKLTGTNATLADPKATVTDQYSLIKSGDIFTKTVEIKYNCIDEKNGVLNIDMVIIAKGCEEIKLSWTKVCKPIGIYYN